MLIYAPFAWFCYTSWHFYAFSGTNLLMRCHIATVPVSYFLLFLCFRKATQEIFSELDETKAEVPIFPGTRRSPKQRRRGTEGSRTIGWRGPPPGHATRWCGPLVHPLTSPFRLYILLDEKTLGPNSFLENILQAIAIVNARSGGSRSSCRHPTREGNHHWRPSSSPCLLRSDV
jgi:hypothetical protein